MLLRSLKLVQFEGVADLQVRDLAAGVHGISLPPGAPPEVVLRAVRFALFGGPTRPGDVISEGAGHAWVELGFLKDDGAPASVFRGVDRRGTWQVSLREDDGKRITSGAADVLSRIEALTGASGGAFDRASFVRVGEDPGAGAPEPPARARVLSHAAAAAAPAPSEPGRSAPGPAETEAARVAADEAIDALRRSVRARTLLVRAAADLDALVALGARLRRDRTDASVAIERLTAECGRLRLRIAKLEGADAHAADLDRESPPAARPSPPASPPTGRSSAGPDAAPAERAPDSSGAIGREERTAGVPVTSASVEFGIGLCALTLLTLLVLPETSGLLRSDPIGRTAAGLGFVVTAASYLWVATRRHGGGRIVHARDVAPRVPAEAPAATGAAQSDVSPVAQAVAPTAAAPTAPPAAGEPAAGLPDMDVAGPRPAAPDVQSAAAGRDVAEELRARLAELDGQVGPMVRKLERTDESLAILDVETGRAARALRRPPPPRTEATSGLGERADPRSIDVRVMDLGDGIHRAAVERDALVAGGACSPAEAARTVEDALRRLGAACGREADAVAALAAEGATPVLVDHLPGDVDADALAARLTAAAADLARRAPPASAAPAVPAAIDAAGESLGALLSPVLASITGGRWRRARVEGGALALDGPGGPVRWESLDPATRTRVGLAARLRDGEARLGPGGGAPRVVVLDARPGGFSTDADLAAFAATHAPRVTQILYARAAAAPPPAAAAVRSDVAARAPERRPA